MTNRALILSLSSVLDLTPPAYAELLERMDDPTEDPPRCSRSCSIKPTPPPSRTALSMRSGTNSRGCAIHRQRPDAR